MKKGKKLLALILAVVTLFSVMTVAGVNLASAADYTSATAMVAQIPSTGAPKATGEKNWYKITATAEFTTVTLTHAESTSTDVFFTAQIFSAENAAMAVNPIGRLDSKGTEGTTSIKVATAIAGTYYISVETNNASAVGINYSISYAGASADAQKEVEPNDNAAVANSTKGKIAGRLEATDSADWFKYSVSESCYLNVSLKHEPKAGVTASYFNVTVFSADGTTRVDSFSSLGQDSTSTWSANPIVSAGTYYIQVVDGGSLSGVDYEINVTTIEIPDHEDEAEPNNDTATANQIKSGMPMIGALDRTAGLLKDTEDYYKFTLVSTAMVSFKFDHATQNNSNIYFRVKLINAANNELVSLTSNGNEPSIESKELYVGSGTYYLRVYRDTAAGDIDSVINYSLALTITTISGAEAEPNDSFDKATPITCGTAKEPTLYSANLSAKEDVDYYSFTLPKRGYIYVIFKSEGNGSNTLYKGTISKLSETSGVVSSIKIKDFNVDYSDGKYTSGCIGLDAGTYYLSVNARSYDSSALPKYATGIQYSSYDGYEIEPNDTHSTAQNLITGSSKLYMNACSFDNSDEDWFKFKIGKNAKDENQTVKVSFTCKRSYTNAEISSGIKDSNECKWNVDVYKEGDYSNHVLTFNFNNKEDTTKSVDLSTGTYYIRIRGNSAQFTSKDYYIEAVMGTKDPSTPTQWLTALIRAIIDLDWSNFVKSFQWISSINWGSALLSLSQAFISIINLIAKLFK